MITISEMFSWVVSVQYCAFYISFQWENSISLIYKHFLDKLTALSPNLSHNQI